MANFEQAIKWMKEGKKVRRDWVGKDVFIYLKGVYLYPLDNEGEKWEFGINDFEATDWILYEKIELRGGKNDNK